MNSLLKLLKPKLLALKNSLTVHAVVRRAPFICIGVLLWALLYHGAYTMLGFLRGVDILGDGISMKIPSLLFLSLTGFLLFSNGITAISAFYLSKDIPLLLSKPVTIKSIIGLKTCETILNSSWMVVFFVPPIFLAYGAIYDAPWHYYPAFLGALLFFVMIPAGVGISFVHLLTRIFPVKKTRQVLFLLGLLIFLALYFLLRSFGSMHIDNPEELLTVLMIFKVDSPLLPHYWMAETYAPLLKGEFPDYLYPLLLVSSGAFFLMVSGEIGYKTYVNNLDRLHRSSLQKGKRWIMDSTHTGSAVLRKDVTVFFRDPEQWSQLVIIGALVMIFVYNVKSVPVTVLAGFTPYLKEILVMVNGLLSGLVLTAVSARFLYVAVSIEGKSFRILKSSPITMKRVVISKYLFGCIPITAVVTGLVWTTDTILRADSFLMYASLGTSVILCLSVCGMAAGLGAMHPQFDHENIASTAMGIGSVLFMFIAFSVVTATVSLEAWAVYIHKKSLLSGRPLGLLEYTRIIAAGALITALNSLAFYLPMKKGIRRLDDDITGN